MSTLRSKGATLPVYSLKLCEQPIYVNVTSSFRNDDNFYYYLHAKLVIKYVCSSGMVNFPAGDKPQLKSQIMCANSITPNRTNSNRFLAAVNDINS